MSEAVLAGRSELITTLLFTVPALEPSAIPSNLAMLLAFIPLLVVLLTDLTVERLILVPPDGMPNPAAI